MGLEYFVCSSVIFLALSFSVIRNVFFFDKENQKKEEQNLETVLLIEPSNEEAILMSMKIALEKSNYAKVKNLSETFVKVCKKLCDENDSIKQSLQNIESKNES